ncbi:MAG: aldo/keto reductase [Colwellia sp.]|nr:aldo/keto reductase [Colwellia sp.]
MTFKKNYMPNTNIQVSELGLGAGPIGNLYQQMTDEEAYNTICLSLQSGMNLIDTAPYYGMGLSERRIGDGTRTVSHSDYVLSTKVGRLLIPSEKVSNIDNYCNPMPFEPKFDYSYDGIMRSFEDSIQRLGHSKIDILYIHDIDKITHGEEYEYHFRMAMNGGYKALDELRSSGLVQAIGLGVNDYQVCEEAMKYGDFNCFLIAGRYTLLEQGALQTFLPKCESKNISVIVGGPYNSGILATGVKDSNRPLHYNYKKPPASVIDKVTKLENICDDFSIPLAAAALQFPLAHPAIISVVVGLNSVSQVESTIANYQAIIPKEFWQTLKDNCLILENAPTPD